MIQYGDFDSVNNQEASSANIRLVKSKTVFVIDVLETKVILYVMFVFESTFIKCPLAMTYLYLGAVYTLSSLYREYMASQAISTLLLQDLLKSTSILMCVCLSY